jgi:hypothetical protein
LIIIRLLYIFFLHVWHTKEFVLSVFMHFWLVVGYTRLYHILFDQLFIHSILIDRQSSVVNW